MKQYEKLTNQPLVIALAEFRFSTVLQIEKYISEFQDYLRQDFPYFSTTQQQEMIVEQNGIQVNTTNAWVFLSGNKKRAFILDKDRLIFLDGQYNRFPDFSNNCETALSFIENRIKPSLLLRIGLRYSDLIIGETENEEIENYVKSVVCDSGVFNDIGQQVHNINETVIKTDAGIMTVRSLYGNLNLSVWQDLSDPPIEIPKHNNHSKRILLDFDHYWQPQSEISNFKLDNLLNKLHALHEGSRKAFWEITTPEGRENWK